jgi:hypothetical protein
MTASRDPKPTVDFIDVYCTYYQDLFPEVRSFANSYKNLRKYNSYSRLRGNRKYWRDSCVLYNIDIKTWFCI